MYVESGGNPFYLEMLQRMGLPAGDGPPSAYAPTGDGAHPAWPPAGDAPRPTYAPHPAYAPAADLPHGMGAPLAGELAQLTPEQLTVLRAAAVLGDPFDGTALFAVAGLPEDVTLAALDVLAALDLVRADAGARRLFAFRHPLVRRVAYEWTPPGWRLAAHGRADRALRDAGASVVQRAPHVARAARPGDEDAVRVLRDAAALTLRSAPSTAATWMRAALKLVPADASRTRLDLLVALARALGVTGDLHGFRATLDEALALLPREDRERRAGVVALQATVERILGSTSRARAILEAELAGAPERDPAYASLRLQLATVLMTQRAHEESAGGLNAAVRAARAAGDESVRTAAAACRALGAAYAGRTTVLRRQATVAARAVDTMDDAALTPHLDPLGQLGWAELLAERYDDALRHLTRGIEVARRTGQSHLMPYLLLGHSWAQRLVGQLTEALRSAESGEEMAHLLGRADLLGHALALRASAVAMRDGPHTAAPIAERALRHINPYGRLWGLAATVLAQIRLDQGCHDDCVRLIESITRKVQVSGPAWCVKAS